MLPGHCLGWGALAVRWNRFIRLYLWGWRGQRVAIGRVAIEHGHPHIFESRHYREATFHADDSVALLRWIDFELEFFFGVLTIYPKFYEAREFLALLNIEMSTCDEERDLCEKVFGDCTVY